MILCLKLHVYPFQWRCSLTPILIQEILQSYGLIDLLVLFLDTGFLFFFWFGEYTLIQVRDIEEFFDIQFSHNLNLFLIKLVLSYNNN